MATIRDLKKDINHVLGEIIEMTLHWAKANPKADRKASAAIVDEAISAYESFSAKIYQKEVENKIITDIKLLEDKDRVKYCKKIIGKNKFIKVRFFRRCVISICSIF